MIRREPIDDNLNPGFISATALNEACRSLWEKSRQTSSPKLKLDLSEKVFAPFLRVVRGCGRLHTNLSN